MIVFPNAKINLGLNIVAKRPDGFHNIESVFCPIGWKDALEILPADNFKFTSSGIKISAPDEINLCVKAYKSLQSEFDLPNVHIHLHKNIPIGAGLGGGSSDAAFTVKALNTIFNLALSMEQMESIVKPLGSDCTFFLHNAPQFGTEKGDRLESININLTDKFIFLVYPNISISTAEAYASVNAAAPVNAISSIIQHPVHSWKNSLLNDFEKSVFMKYPVLNEIKQTLYARGAWYAAMSGSGSTMFGLFDSLPNTENLFPETYQTWSGKINF